MVMEDALVTYYEPVTECQMTDDVNNGKDMNKLGVWINGNEQSYTYSIQANDVVTKLGAQGRTTEVYSDRIVMIDTFLAKVEKSLTPLMTRPVTWIRKLSSPIRISIVQRVVLLSL